MAATTLQALEMTNGSTLADFLHGAAARLANGDSPGPARFVRRLFRQALGRDPTAGEQAVAVELLDSRAGAEGIEDLLWVVTMLPEFQLIR